MSIIHEKSPKHCAEKQATRISNRSKKKALIYASIFFLSLILILLLCFILHPTNPHLSLTQASINHLNSSINLTLLSTNPNKIIGIYYSGFLIHASYNSHAITPNTWIPPFFQDHQQTNLLSASLLANASLPHPVAGKVPLGFTAAGTLRWKVGIWISRRYRINVDCMSVLPLTPLNSKQAALCSTSI
ncbi:NDR1/HIN1-like protein 26 [Salvia miltiorrhiza]|uniref:NDR1/HIN1-like protein 26 n=1 Tax=Salvia miltiorrhiza TaxID=226208 RepID=UPI0025ACDE55|nr:NDR1/HIN1-like protein 26 [Salvia miltiorrhiza]